ncbi:hypothetical protein KAR91_31360 [Candidatus Pacearchaeota archaeon]|nr:hypothetical protein [Candidatus Pacearchaeota archaeon]
MIEEKYMTQLQEAFSMFAKFDRGENNPFLNIFGTMEVEKVIFSGTDEEKIYLLFYWQKADIDRKKKIRSHLLNQLQKINEVIQGYDLDPQVLNP